MQSYGIEGSVLRLLKDYLTGRQQRVVLNGKTLSQLNLTASVPQSSVLEPLLFLIAINNFPDDIASSYKIFANDKFLFLKIENKCYSNFYLMKTWKQ